MHTWYTQNQKRFFLVNSIEDTYIFFLYVSAVSQSITHLIDVITINTLIIHSDRSWEISVQQWHTLLNDKTLTNHVHLDVDIHVNLCFCLLIFLNYMLFIYESLQRELLVFPLMIWSIRWKFVFSRNLEMIHMQHQINEYSIYIRFFWSILDLFIFTISKVMILSIVHITRYVKQILAITWWSV